MSKKKCSTIYEQKFPVNIFCSVFFKRVFFGRYELVARF